MPDIFDEIAAEPQKDIFDELTAGDAPVSVAAQPVAPAAAPRLSSLQRAEKLSGALQKSGLYGSATAAMGQAVDKGIRRRPDGALDLPFLMPAPENSVMRTFAGLTQTLAQKTGARLDDAGIGVDKDAVRGVFEQFKQDEVLSDDDLSATWADLGNLTRKWDRETPARVLSDGSILPNFTNSDWLESDKAGKMIDGLPAPDAEKAKFRANLPAVQSAIAKAKIDAYTAASTGVQGYAETVNPLFGKQVGKTVASVSPQEWANRTGRKDFGTPKFVRDYEKAVADKAGWLKGLAVDFTQSALKLSTQLHGLAGVAGAEGMGAAGAEMSGFSGLMGEGGKDTGMVGSIVEESLPIGFQIAVTRGLGMGAAALGATAGTQAAVGTLGALTMAGGQSAGATYASEVAAGATPEEAQAKAVRAGLSTALITGIFQKLGAGGVEKVAVGKAVGDVTVRDLIASVGREELVRNTRSFAGQVLKATAGEGAEEGIDQLVGAFLNADPDTNLADAWEQAVEAAKIGAVIGGTVDVAQKALQSPEMQAAEEMLDAAEPHAPDTVAAAEEALVADAIPNLGETRSNLGDDETTTTTEENIPEADAEGEGSVPPRSPESMAPEGSPVAEGSPQGDAGAGVVSIDNLDDIVSQGGGTVSVSRDGRKVNFDQFGLVIDGNTAEVAFVELNPSERGSGIGVAAYKQLGEQLAAKGITLRSSGAQYKNGRSMWMKLANQGNARSIGNGRFEFVATPATSAPRATRHRVFEGGSPISVKPAAGVLEARDPSKAYRVTGQPQIDDILNTGEVRAKEGKMRGGRYGETQWTRGDKTLGYDAAGNSGRYVIETSADGLNDRQGGLPKSDVAKIYRSDGTSWIDVTDDIISTPSQSPTAETPTPQTNERQVAPETPVSPEGGRADFAKGQSVNITLESGDVVQGNVVDVVGGEYVVQSPGMGGSMRKRADELAPITEASPVPLDGGRADKGHLDALELGLSRARERARVAKTPGEKRSRDLAVTQYEKEIAAEREFLGLPKADTAEMSDEELLAALEDPKPKTRLDLILDEVEKSGEVSITLEDEMSPERVMQVSAAAEARGMEAAYDGKGFLIRKTIAPQVETGIAVSAVPAETLTEIQKYPDFAEIVVKDVPLNGSDLARYLAFRSSTTKVSKADIARVKKDLSNPTPSEVESALSGYVADTKGKAERDSMVRDALSRRGESPELDAALLKYDSAQTSLEIARADKRNVKTGAAWEVRAKKAAVSDAQRKVREAGDAVAAVVRSQSPTPAAETPTPAPAGNGAVAAVIEGRTINPKDRNQFPGEDYAVPPNVVFIQPRGLDTEPLTDRVWTFPYDGTAEDAAKVGAKAFQQLEAQFPDMSQRESLFRASGADGMTRYRMGMDMLHDKVKVSDTRTPEGTESPQPPAPDKSMPHSVEAIKTAFGVDDDVAVATDALARAMGVDLAGVRYVRGGKPGSGALSQANTEEQFTNEIRKYVTGEWAGLPNAERESRLNRFIEDRLTELGAVRTDGGGWRMQFDGESVSIRTRESGASPSSADILPNGDVVIAFRYSTTSLFARPDESELASKVRVAKMIEEEIIHAAELLALKARVGVQTDYKKATSEEASRILESILTDSPDRVFAEQVILASIGIYNDRQFSREELGSMDLQAEIANLSAGQKAIALGELVRQVVQLRQSGQIAETSYMDIIGKLAEWIRGYLGYIKQVAIRPSALGPLFEQEVRDTETVLASLNQDIDTARFAELTAGIPANPTPADLDAWRSANPEAYQELKAMRERVLRAAGYDGDVMYHTTGANEPFTEFKYAALTGGEDRYRVGGHKAALTFTLEGLGAGWFTSNGSQFSGWQNSDASNVVRAKVNLSNPLKIEADPFVQRAFVEKKKELADLRAKIKAVQSQETFITQPEFKRIREREKELAREVDFSTFDEDQVLKLSEQLNETYTKKGIKDLEKKIRSLSERTGSREEILKRRRELKYADPFYGLMSLSETAQQEYPDLIPGAAVRAALKEQGYDGVILQGTNADTAMGDTTLATWVIPFDGGATIKSTEPLNLSPDGRLIPPSEWGDTGSPSILYQGVKDINASVEFLEDGTTIIRALKSGNATSLFHEFQHVFDKQVMDSDTPHAVATRKRLGITDDMRKEYHDDSGYTRWKTLDAAARTPKQKQAAFKAWEKAYENRARWVERYIYDGVAPSQRLADLFDKMSKWFKEVYGSIVSATPIKAVVPESARKIFDKVFEQMPSLEQLYANTPPEPLVPDVTVEFVDSFVPEVPSPPVDAPKGEDAAYLAAVETGDMETAQRMVDEAARAAGYVRVFHTTPNEYPARPVEAGDWVSEDTDSGRDYQADYNGENWENENQVSKAYVHTSALKDQGTGFAPGQTLVIGVVGEDGKVETDDIRPFHIKSSDPVAYDELNRPIPLSQRFGSTLPPASNTPAPSAHEPTEPGRASHEMSDAERARFGLPPRLPQPPVADAALWQKAQATEDAHRAAGNKNSAGTDLMMSKLGELNFVLNPDEQALIIHEIVARRNVLTAAQDAAANLPKNASQFAKEQAAADVKSATEQYNQVLDFNDAAGSEEGRAFRLRRWIMALDYTQEGLSRRLRVAKNTFKPGQELTNAEIAAAAEYAEKLKAAQAKLEELTGENAEQARLIEALRADIAQAKASTEKPVSAKVRKAVTSRADAARARLKEKGITFLAQAQEMDAQTLKDFSAVAAEWLLGKPLTLAEFTQKLVNTFGTWISDHAERIFKGATQVFNETEATVTGRNAPSPGEALDMVETADKTEPTRKEVWDIARAYVMSDPNMRGAPAVLDATHEALTTKFPDLTRERVAELFTDYGKIIKPDPAPAATELGRIKNLERIALKIADLKAGRAPKNTGRKIDPETRDMEVRVAEREFRRLYKELVESGAIPDDGAGNRAKSALAAAKTRMRNAIEELEAALAPGGKAIPSTKSALQLDAEALDLKARLETLRNEYDEAFRKEGLTMAQRQALAIRALDRQIAEETEMLKNGILKRAKAVPVDDTPEIAERRRILAEKRQIRRDLYEAEHPLEQVKAATERSIERLRSILEQGVIAVRERTPVEPDAELRAMLDVKEALADEVAELRRQSEQYKSKQIENALRSAEAALDRVSRKLASGELTVPAKTPSAASRDAGVVAIRERVKELNRDLDARRREAKVGPYSDAARLARQLATLAKRKAELERRIREKDISKKPKPLPIDDQMLRNAEYEIELLKSEFSEIEAKIIRDNLPLTGLAQHYGWGMADLMKVHVLGSDFGVLFRALGVTFQGITMFYEVAIAKALRKPVSEKGKILGRILKAGIKSFGDPAFETAVYKYGKTRPGAQYDGVGTHKIILNPPFEVWDATREDIPRADLLRKIPWYVWPILTGVKIYLLGTSLPVAIPMLATATFAKPLLIRLDRAQRAATNMARIELADLARNAASANGAIPLNEYAHSVINNAVMVDSGRGDLPEQLAGAVRIAGLFFIAPRFYLSRMAVVIGQPLWLHIGKKGTGRARAEVAKNYGRSVIGRGTAYLLIATMFASKWDDDDEDEFGLIMDPWSSDWFKLRVNKNIKLDFMSSYNSFAGILVRLFTRKKYVKEENKRGKYVSLGAGFSNNWNREAGNFIASKQSLIMRLVTSSLIGQYYGGKPVTWGTALDQMTTAIIINDARRIFEEMIAEYGPVEGVLKAQALCLAMWGGATVNVKPSKEELRELEGFKEDYKRSEKLREREMNRKD